MDGKRYTIVYEDEQIIVVDKPSGMLVIPTPKKETNTLTDLLNRELDERGIEANACPPARENRAGRRAYPCHRIDRETSGLIIYAKGKAVQQMMMEEFRKRAVKKTYIAFVNGRTAKDFDIIKKRIYNRNKKRFDEAVTKYKTIERREEFTIVEAEPVTGRTNQIRIHFKGIGHPLVGESVFAFRKDFKLKFKRAALHASYIRFTHPVTKASLDFSAPMPSDMEKLLNETRNTNDERRTCK